MECNRRVVYVFQENKFNTTTNNIVHIFTTRDQNYVLRKMEIRMNIEIYGCAEFLYLDIRRGLIFLFPLA